MTISRGSQQCKTRGNKRYCALNVMYIRAVHVQPTMLIEREYKELCSECYIHTSSVPSKLCIDEPDN